MSDCPPLNQPDGSFSFEHPWHPAIKAVEGALLVEACNGHAYMLSGLPMWIHAPWWYGRYTKSEKRAAKWLRQCQEWCDRENAKDAKKAKRTTEIIGRLSSRQQEEKG
jgi:hypothetical protein